MVGSHTDQFDAAMETVTQERGSVYGHPANDFLRVASLKLITAGGPHPSIRHALDMICVKIARLVETPTHMDSVIDIAGYARTIAMILDDEEERHTET